MRNYGNNDRSRGSRGGRGGYNNRRDDNRGGGRDRFDSRNSGRGGKRMHHAVCADCGDDCQVPFVPSSGKPVYCSDCFEDRGNGKPNRNSRPSRNSQPQKDYTRQIETLDAKLDKILEILNPRQEVIETKPTKSEKAALEVKKEPVTKTEADQVETKTEAA